MPESAQEPSRRRILPALTALSLGAVLLIGGRDPGAGRSPTPPRGESTVVREAFGMSPIAGAGPTTATDPWWLPSTEALAARRPEAATGSAPVAVGSTTDGDAPVTGDDPTEREGVEEVGHDEDAETVATAGESPEDYLVLEGAAAAGAGETRRFTVEVEPGLEAHAAGMLAVVEEALLDERSWARDHRLVQVVDPERAHVRVVLADPSTVDDRCAAAGLDTRGDSSCWDGQRAMLNADRWRDGVDHVEDLWTYRAYLVNHEVGHGLGHGHLECPAPDEAAPVMMQQTLGLEGCVANPWPYPDHTAR